MQKFSLLIFAPLLLASCTPQNTPVSAAPPKAAVKKTGALTPLQIARKGFKTVVKPSTERSDRIEIAPPKIFRTLKYPSPVGPLGAYLTPDPKDGKKHPAIVWITGGDCNSIGDVWTSSAPDNDQTAAAFRRAKIVMMFPSLRGGNRNPGRKEGFLGEVDDVLAAANFLAKQPYVDPKRIYLGGHSTGGTLALLVAQCSSRFRGVFAFGPVDNPAGYGEDSGFVPFDIGDEREVNVRAPGLWLDSVASPTWVIEGTQEGNIDSLVGMKEGNDNPRARFVSVEGASHFDVLAPVNALIANKILSDKGPTTNIVLTDAGAKSAWSQVFEAPSGAR